MVKFKVIFRSLFRQKLNTGIIIVSLAIGMACINLMAMFIQRELNTDGFHRYKDQIYALKCEYKTGKFEQVFDCGVGAVEYMKNNFVQIVDYCRVKDGSVSKVIANNETYFDRSVIMKASNNFFEFFTYSLLTNNPKTALEANNNLVISEDLAHKYFGFGNAVGQVITFVNGNEKEPMVVTGIFRKPLDNSQLNFDMIRPILSGENSGCYVRLSQNANPNQLDVLLKANRNSLPGINGEPPGIYHLKPLCENYFEDPVFWSIVRYREKTDLWIALFIGLVIICIATFNYLGLVNNSLFEKNKAYVVKRINGGTKIGFVLSYMFESLIALALSFILSILLMLWMAPFFNELTKTNITFGFILRPQQIIILGTILLLLLITTFLFVSFRINTSLNLNSLKSGGKQIGKRTQFPAFNVFQLASSLVLISFSIIILKQANYITEKPIGLDKQVIEVRIPGQYANKVSVFKELLISNSSISQVAVGTSPVSGHSILTMDKQNGIEEELRFDNFGGDENYISTLGIQILEGSVFSKNYATDKNKCLVNESFAHLYPNQDLIGKGLPGREFQIVIGIVKDFHYMSLKTLVEPGFISFYPNGTNLLVKASVNQQAQAYEAIAQTWKQLIPDYPLNAETIGTRYELMHRENKDFLLLIGTCCFISIFLSIIGLFAISYQNSQSRTKEIGIRKVNGAKISEVMTMLNKDFVKWVAIAFVIATPIAYYAMHKWLESFAYKTELSWWVYALAGLIALAIALITVSWQSWKAATRNPVEALRYE